MANRYLIFGAVYRRKYGSILGLSPRKFQNSYQKCSDIFFMDFNQTTLKLEYLMIDAKVDW